MSPGLPVPVSSPASVPALHPLTAADIETYADRMLVRSRQYVLGDPRLRADCRNASRMLRGLLSKLDKAVGSDEAARLIAEISLED